MRHFHCGLRQEQKGATCVVESHFLDGVGARVSDIYENACVMPRASPLSLPGEGSAPGAHEVISKNVIAGKEKIQRAKELSAASTHAAPSSHTAPATAPASARST